MRRFSSGDEFEHSGIRFRVVVGDKRPRGPGVDLRLDWWTPNGWRAVNMRAMALMADFFFENEDVLYPPPTYEGGKYVRAYLNHAMKHGWEKAEAGLRIERRYADARLF